LCITWLRHFAAKPRALPKETTRGLARGFFIEFLKLRDTLISEFLKGENMPGNQEAYDSLLANYLVLVLKELKRTATASELAKEVKVRANVDIDAHRVNRLLKPLRSIESKQSFKEEDVGWTAIS
jgi:hypothetical protein